MTSMLHRIPQRRAIWLLVGVCCVAPAVHGANEFSPEAYLKHVKYLASDELAGRGNGTKELEKAGDYIAAQFAAIGLKPGAPGGTWFQPFEIVTGLTIGQGNQLTVRTGTQRVGLELGRSYYPLSATSNDSARTVSYEINNVPLAFAGYGIDAKQHSYNDYANIDVKDKAVIVFSHEPQENDPDSKFAGRQLTRYSTLLEKAMTARNRGAKALLVVTDPTHDTNQGNYAGFAKDPQAENYGLPVLRIDRERVLPLLKAWELDALAKDIDRDLKPRSRDLPGAAVDYVEHLAKTRRKIRNVIGVLPGSDAVRAKEAVVIGAHYDHLGLGGRHSLSPELAGQIHNGADDNASGTAAVIEMARAASANRKRFPRTTVFVAFAGEEIGLLGSAQYVSHPAIPLAQTIGMINLDMVGRSQGNILLSGLDASPSLNADVDAAAKVASGLTVKRFQEGAGVGSSDDTSFAVKKIPALGFFSGFHSDYHRPGDDWQKIDAAGAVQVMTLAFELAARISEKAQRPEFVPVQSSHTPASSSGGDAGAIGGYGPYFGSVPDFGESDKGVKFAEVRETSPAGRAGLRGGDVMVEFDGKATNTLADFTFALRDKRPGDVVQVKVLRNGQPLTVMVTLSTRP
jgi:hypothetical protein